MTQDRTGIQLEAVRLRLGSTDFTFDAQLPAGRITAIAGASGSGKSTLLNLVAGFETPDSGRVLIDGLDMTDRHPSKRPVSLVFQDNNLFAHLDLFTNVGLGLDPTLSLDAAAKRAVSEALSRVGLAGFERRRPPTLSGGERQRAAFARALVRRKPVLLLDEPFAALDPGLRSDMAKLLVSLHRETENTVLMVSHDAGEVMALAGHILFVDAGRIVFGGTPQAFEKSEISAINRFLGA
ncbi:ATP-binding cassette domain-containing protein [Rhizobium halophytocola]|uniref:Thiamine transport system ATP-binding protein n=1 Tax=Rhizobium halophytocola TaxID=735519 RepID=A0ABS4E200_9HYPH|nr:ATP-binding cassette domain-containing protein [Rhizobium halophytocola]MBP1851957.1 thiamine transport system ATP-binding protein [Rhizobium halophytocola]